MCVLLQRQQQRMIGGGVAQPPAFVGNVHRRQPGGELQRVLQPQQLADIERVMERRTLVVEHDVVRARHADQNVNPAAANSVSSVSMSS